MCEIVKPFLQHCVRTCGSEAEADKRARVLRKRAAGTRKKAMPHPRSLKRGRNNVERLAAQAIAALARAPGFAHGQRAD